MFISLKDLSLSFPNKCCFDYFSAQIYPGSRIAIIGRNGSGKSSLLKILHQSMSSTSGQVVIPDGLCVGYVEQTISDYADLSGGQRLNKRLSEALARSPDLLLLDEPTNHLDSDNRKSLIRMLKAYHGTLVIVSHDTELLRQCADIIWHIDDNQVHVFSGSYDYYMNQRKQKRSELEKELVGLKRSKKETHNHLMQEQHRAAKSRSKGEKSIDQRKWPTVVSKGKARRAEKTSGKKKAAIDRSKQDVMEQLSDLRLPEIIAPRFHLNADCSSKGSVLSISRASIGYCKENMLLNDINMSLSRGERIAVIGNNASGKSTLLKAILRKEEVLKTGDWHMPDVKHMGYLDQHYSTLSPNQSVMEHVRNTRPDWSEGEARRHLNDFLFRTNEEIANLGAHLSGGEKARVSLSVIAANPPRLLILDEITNNLDLETKEHVIQVLKAYPGSMIVVSHESDFLEAIGVDRSYAIEDGVMI